MTLKAVIFDVDGTLADTERDGHRPAFNAAFAAHGLDIAWSPDEYGDLLTITGGRRRIAHDLRARGYGDDTAEALAADVHRTKTTLFERRIVEGGMTPRPGLPELIADLRAHGVHVAVATTGSRAWVDPLVRCVLGDGVAEVVVTGDDVTHLKPDPEVYLRAMAELGVGARDVLAVEDSAVGLRSAIGAGLATAVVTNGYTAGQDFTGAAAVQPCYLAPQLDTARCLLVHRQWWSG